MTYAFVIDSVEFSRDVIAGRTSLGGSESACLGLARALAARGADVQIFTTQLAPDAAGPDGMGCTWHPIEAFRPMNQFIEWDVVIALRWFAFFGQFPVYARLRILWNQDLLVPGDMVRGVMSVGWAFDKLVYVSEYHRAQWEDLEPALAGHGWVTRNGYDPANLPASSTKDPNRIVHISRPERGLAPILKMWPALRAKYPHATLQLCRYSSMYDAGGWGEVCKSYDRAVAEINAQVGGITYLGELNKKQLYQAISDAAVMWYPGVATFAETSCCAATEANACGTPFVGSLKGALPETARPSFDAGLLIAGDAEHDEAYQAASIEAVGRMLDGCKRNTVAYRALQLAGRAHVGLNDYSYDALALEWEKQIDGWFQERYETHKIGVLRQLLHEDDHVAAKIVAHQLLGSHGYFGATLGTPDEQMRRAARCEHDWNVYDEALTAAGFCDKVIAGKDHTSEQYGAAAIADPLREVEFSDRFKAVMPHFAGCTSVLDVACGNGSFAIALALSNPTVKVHGLDYSEANIERAKDGAERAGVGDRCTFERVTVYDFDAQELHAEWRAFQADDMAGFDGMFVGEFVEHVAQCTMLVDHLEDVLTEGAKVVYTCPVGACAEMVPRWMPLHRGHVHRFHHDDVKAVWGPKLNFAADYLAGGLTERGMPIGNWLIRYEVAPNRPAGNRPLAERIQRTRPLPKLSVGIIAKDAELDLAKCLSSVWPIAEEIIVGDTGSKDDTKAIALKYGARVLDLAPVEQQPEGFAGARNEVLAHCTGDWFLWIDADEQLMEKHWLRRYLDGSVFNGYVLHQTHLYLDGPPTYDKPVRLFRMGMGTRFYGCIHEQPQTGDANTDIFPTLEPFDVQIAHVGYLTEAIRAEKRVSRNLPLLIKDQKVFGDRLLGKVLCVREAVIQADDIRANNGGQLVPRAMQGYQYAVMLFVTHFDDPAHKYHGLARPWYEAALRHLGIGYEFETALAGRKGGLEGRRAGAERMWVRDGDEAQRIMQWKLASIKKAMEPVTFHVDPFVLPTIVREEVAVTA